VDFVIEATDWTCDQARLARVRRAVFIVEQGVPEALEWDAHDAAARHFLATTRGGQPIGCARLLAEGVIGRMAVLPAWRGRGVGRALLANALAAAADMGLRSVRLSAQTHAVPFYERAGFVCIGAPYLDAGIAHIAMEKSL
jgi:predicted GNAT family N-acyltransferase